MKIKTVVLTFLFMLIAVFPAYAADSYITKQPTNINLGTRAHDFIVRVDNIFSVRRNNTTPSPRADGACALLVDTRDIDADYNPNTRLETTWTYTTDKLGNWSFAIDNIESRKLIGNTFIIYYWTGSSWVTTNTFNIYGYTLPAWDCIIPTKSGDGLKSSKFFYTNGYDASYRVYLGNGSTWTLLKEGTDSIDGSGYVYMSSGSCKYRFTTADTGKYLKWEVVAEGTTYTHQELLSITNTTTNITFDANGGSGTATIVCEKGTSVLQHAPTVSRPDYEFLGWFTQPSGGTQLSDEVVSYEKTYYAQWKLVHTHAYNTFVSYVSAPTCTSTGVGT